MEGEKTKLVLVSDTSGLNDKSKQILNILENIDRKKFEIYLICPPGYLSAGGKTLSGVAVINWRNVSVLNPFCYLKIKSLINKIRSDKNPFGPFVLHSFGLGAAFISFVSLPKTIKKIFSRYSYEYNFFENYLLKRVAYISNKILINSRQLEGKMKQYVLEKCREDVFEIVPEAIETHKISKVKEKIKEKNNAPVIGTIGALSGDGGQRYLVEAALKLKENFPLINIDIIGSGEEKDTLTMQVKKLNIEKNVSLIGHRNVLSKYFKHFDVYVSTSETNISNATILEAMASGVPIVATKTASHQSIIVNNKNGLLIDSRDADAIYKAVKKILTSPVFASKLKREALKEVQLHDGKKICRRIEEIYAK